jgi:hypothetical protein
MQTQKPCCPAAAARMIRKLTLRDGDQVGIVNLDQILNEVAHLNLVEAAAIKKELLARAKAYNYVEPVVEEDCANALLAEYERQRTKEPKATLSGLAPRRRPV